MRYCTGEYLVGGVTPRLRHLVGGVTSFCVLASPSLYGARRLPFCIRHRDALSGLPGSSRLRLRARHQLFPDVALGAFLLFLLRAYAPVEFCVLACGPGSCAVVRGPRGGGLVRA